MITVYGIKNCNTMKKAFTWLDEHHIDYHFHNYKTQGLTESTLKDILSLTDVQTILNKKGMTWRNLDESIKNSVVDEQSAIAVMLSNPSMIKRPILVKDKQIIVGFSDDIYSQFFNESC